MRFVLLFLAVVMLAVSGWFIWQGLTERPEAPTQASSVRPERSPGTQDTKASQSPTPTAAPAPATAKPEASVPSPTVTTTFRPSEEKDDGMAQKLLDEGVEAFNRGDYRESLRIFSEAVPLDNHALTGVGLSHYKLDDYRTAARVLKQSVDENGAEFNALKFLALAHYKLDELEQSEGYAVRALTLKNDQELRAFLDKLRRERRALTNRVDESNLHFKVIFDGYEHGSISRLILDVLDSAYRDIGREFGHFPDGTITVVLYTEHDFFDVTRAPSWAGGLFDGKIRVPVKGAESVDRELLRIVLYHEYVHAMVHDISRTVPRWVHEGLAEYLVPRGMQRIGQALPFSSLERAFFSGDQRIALLAYEESYSAMAHLVERYSLYDIKEFLIAMGRGESMEQAFYDTFLITYDQFASSWGI